MILRITFLNTKKPETERLASALLLNKFWIYLFNMHFNNLIYLDTIQNEKTTQNQRKYLQIKYLIRA